MCKLNNGLQYLQSFVTCLFFIMSPGNFLDICQYTSYEIVFFLFIPGTATALEWLDAF